MSVALPIVRFRSDEASGAPLTALGLAAIAIFLFALATFSPKVFGRRRHLVAFGDRRVDYRASRRAVGGPVQPFDAGRAMDRA